MVGQSISHEKAAFFVREVGLPVGHRCPLHVARAVNLSAVALPQNMQNLVQTNHVKGLNYVQTSCEIENKPSQAS